MDNDVGCLKYKLSKCASNVAFSEMFAVIWTGAAIIRHEANLPIGILPVGLAIGFAVFGMFLLKECKQYATEELKKELKYRPSLFLTPTLLLIVEIAVFIFVNIYLPYRFTLGITVAVFGLSLYPVFYMYIMSFMIKKEVINEKTRHT